MWARRVEHVREGGDCQYVVMRSVGHAVGLAYVHEKNMLWRDLDKK